MRIAGYIENPSNKITIFDFGARYIIKWETDQLEFSVKVPREEFASYEELALKVRQLPSEISEQIFAALANIRERLYAA